MNVAQTAAENIQSPKKAPLNMNRSRLYKTPPFKRTLRRKGANQKTPPKEKKLEVLTPEQAEATMGKKKQAKETSIADIPLEAEAAPKSKSKAKSKKPEAPLPPEAQEGIVKFD